MRVAARHGTITPQSTNGRRDLADKTNSFFQNRRICKHITSFSCSFDSQLASFTILPVEIHLLPALFYMLFEAKKMAQLILLQEGEATAFDLAHDETVI